MRAREVLLVSFALIALGTTAKCPKKRTSPIREILCYTSALDAQLLADSICSCTTLVHQHHDIRDLSISDIADLQKSLKEMHPPLQFIISIHDPEMTLRNSTIVRQEAVARIITVINEVDGVEMNVTAGSKERLYNFIKNLKDEMIRKSYDKRIFLTLPIKPEDLAKQFDMKELVKYVDLFTLPTDYMTDEDEAFVTFHPSRLMGLFDMLNTDSLVDLISELGAPKHKIMVTLPANAYRFALMHEAENAPRSQTTEKEPTSIDRKQLCEAINDGEWTVERDEDLTAPYAFQNKTWIAFEDKISVGIKAKYALLRDLAGLAVRDVENDVKTECEMPLTEEIYRSFTEFKRKSRQAVLNALEEDLHQTQFSYPNKAKTSSFRVVRVVDTEGHIRAVRENTQTEFVCRRQGYFVHPKSCNRFYRCVKFNQAIEDYSVFEFDCPAGLSFDERTEVCVWPGSLPQGSPCPGSSEIAPVAPKRFECSQPGYYADPQNCRWFFACMDLGESQLMAFEFRCPYDLVFDEKKLVCEWPWLVPACSGSGSAYTRTEYYGGHTAAGSSTGGATGGYITGGLPEYSVTPGTGHSNIDYSKASTGVQGVSYFTGSTGKHTSGTNAVSGYVGSSPGAIGIDYSKPRGYGSTVSSIPTGPSGIYVSSISPAGKSTGYSTSGSKISTGSTGYRIDGYSGGYTAPSGGVTTGFSGSTVRGYSGTASGSHLAGGGGTYSGRSEPSYPAAGGYTASSGYSGGYTASGGITAGSTAEGYSGTAGGSHLAGGGGTYSGRSEPSYPAAGGYTASSGYSGGYTAPGGITAGSTAEGYSGTAGGSHLAGGGGTYSGRSEPSYSAAGGYTASSGYSGGYTASGGITAGSTAEGYSGTAGGSHLAGGGGTYSGRSEPSYPAAGGYTASSGYSGGYTASGGITAGSTAEGYSGTAGGSHLAGGGGTYSGRSEPSYPAAGGYTASSGYSGGYTASGGITAGSTAEGYSGTAGGSHLAGKDGIYSGRSEPSYSAAGGYTGSVDASKPIVVTYPKTGYFASTESPGSVNIRVDSGPKYVGSTGSSGPTGVDYSKPGYGGTVSSIPTYTGPSSIYFDSISPAGKSSTGYSTSGSKISSTGSTGYRIDGGYSGGYTAPSGRVTTGFSGSTAGGYSGTAGGSRLTGGGAIYSDRSESSYSAAGGYTGSVDASKPIVVTYPKTGYFAPTESPGSPVNIGVDSTGPKYVGSTNLYTSSGAFNADGYSASPGISGGSRQPSFDKTGSAFDIGSSYPGAIGGQSTAKIEGYEGSIGTGYSKATSGILQGSTSSGRVSSATHFGGDASKSITSGISAASGHTDATITGSRYFGSGVPSSGVAGASSTRYDEGYTVPVFLLHGEPTYPLIRPTGAEIKNHTRIPGVIRDYPKPDLVRPNLNISIFGNEIPTAYDIPKGGTVTGSGVQGSIFTDSTSGTVFRHGNIPGATSSPVIHEGTILTGGVQPGYIASGTPQPGYVITDDLKTANIGSAGPGPLIYGSPTPAISVPGPSSDLKGDITPGIVISGQTAPGVSIGSAQPGIVETSTPKSYVSQAGTTYHGGAATRGCSSSYPGEGLTPTRPQGYKPDGGCGINTAYDTGKYSESDVPDYRPTSATLPDSIVPGGRIEGTSNVIFGPTSQSSTTAAPGYPSPTSAVFTPSGFTKTGLTRTGITTAILGGGGSYSVSTSERRPAYPENISEKAFEGAGYTKISSGSNAADLSVTSTPPGYFSTASPSRITQRVQSATSGYSYPKPNVQLGTSGITFTPSVSPIENNLPITSPKPYPSINVDDGSGGINVAFGSKIPTVPTDRRLSTSTVSPVIYTKRPEIYKTTLFEAAKIPVSTFRPIIDAGYKTVTAPSNIPFLTDDRFVQQTGSSQAASTSNIDLGSSFQQTDFSSKKDYGSSLVSEYLPAKASTKPGVIASTTRYEVPEPTVRPDNVGVTYKESSSFAYKGPSSITSPTTFRPSNVYYTGQGFSSSTETTSSGSPTNLGISRDKIDKLITNYNRGTVKYMSSVYDTTAISGFGSSAKFSSPGSTTSSHEVATKSPEDKGKVIVKWSDLHPLLLGKLGAECTCKADPFATLRGPVRKLIASSKGKVDLANYDSSEIYVDLENGSSEGESTDYDGFPAQPYKISPHETSTNQPSSSYLPVPSTTVSARDFGRGFRPESSAGNAPFGVHLGFRTGRKLKDVDSSPNSIAEDDPEDDPDQIINGATDCARPGLFRHPSLCNKFYACHWDQWKKKFTLHIFNCPIHLTFDSKASACNWPSKGPACQADNLLV